MEIFDDLNDYDKIIVSFSGGKDSSAMVLHLLDQGIKPEKIELWHQSIDGRRDTHTPFFDWPSTEGYVRAFAKHLGIRLGWQWREHGFRREMFRNNQNTGSVHYEYEDNYGSEIVLPSRTGHENTRMKWPAKTADLSRRWCTAYLKEEIILPDHKALVPLIFRPVFVKEHQTNEEAIKWYFSKYPEFAKDTKRRRKRCISSSVERINTK